MNEKERILFYVCCYVCIAFAVYLFYHSALLSLASGFLARYVRPFYETYRIRRRMNELSMQFRDLLYSISASIAAGRQMQEAIVEARGNLSVMYDDDAYIMSELSHMTRCIVDNHESDRILLEDFARRSGHEDIRNFVQVYSTCRNMGGDLERIISRASAIITDKMDIEREISTITAQKKLEGRLIALMPPAMLLALNMVSQSYIAPLYSTLSGRLIMTACLAAGVYGVWLMEKISNIEL
ncbi:MAG: hypothetical protein Q4A65_05205 [Bacillota bacterium]|nr:hypothetical protein [Bacillota bacterium]